MRISKHCMGQLYGPAENIVSGVEGCCLGANVSLDCPCLGLSFLLFLSIVVYCPALLLFCHIVSLSLSLQCQKNRHSHLSGIDLFSFFFFSSFFDNPSFNMSSMKWSLHQTPCWLLLQTYSFFWNRILAWQQYILYITTVSILLKIIFKLASPDIDLDQLTQRLSHLK